MTKGSWSSWSTIIIKYYHLSQDVVTCDVAKWTSIRGHLQQDQTLTQTAVWAGVPLRPIASCVNTFEYDLSASLANILSPLTGNSDFMVTNSAHFISIISSEMILDNEIMVSSRVVYQRSYQGHCTSCATENNWRTTSALWTA